QVINGDYDSYIKSWAQGFKNLNAPVLVRLSNEMNGSWTQWSLDDNDQDADLYKLAYRHFVDVIRKQGAENVKFVWNPNATSAPDYSWNDASLFYPGDEYVDWVGLTHYNFGTAEWSKFVYFDDLYKNLYATYLRQFPNKPFIIGEFASAVEGGNKPYFISNYLNNIGSKYRNIRIAIWFDEIDGKYDFRIHSSEATESAFKQGVKNGKFTSYPIY
ncbi:MAG TPA: glycosyl hydrolase, partial [Pseudoneobacillus sp.]|nr:glycosyl hydrolase [Pseudoneobacillus sp.]